MFFTLQDNAEIKAIVKRYALTRNAKMREFIYIQKVLFN